MPISSERLSELRAMSYEDYRQSPEWIERQKRILGRSSICQNCQTNLRLGVYHYTFDRLGAEEDSDLVILCADCYGATRTDAVPTLPFMHKAGIFLGAAGLSTIGLEAILNAPLPAEIAALIVAWFLAKNSPSMYATAKKTLPPELMAWLGLSSAPDGKRSALAHWFKSPVSQREPSSIPTKEEVEAELERLTQKGEIDARELPPDLSNKRVPDPTRVAPNAVTRYEGKDPRIVLDLAENFLPDVNMALREGIFATGVKGSGKTGVLARIIEQIARIAAKFERRGIPFVIFDKEGDLQSLLDLLPNGRIADADHWYTAEQIITGRLQVIVNLHAWLKAEDAAAVMVGLLLDLVEYTSSQKPEGRLPCPVFLDEGQYWLPEESVSYLGKETRKSLLDAFSILLNTGRKRGLTPFIFTQRIAQVDKSVISMGIQIFMRQVIDVDLRRCMEYIRADMVSDKKDLATLGEGEAFVCLPKGVQLRVQFKQRESIHLSHAPTVERIVEQAEEPGYPVIVKEVQEEDLQTLRHMPYAEYLKSVHWQKIRKGALARASYACQVCNARDTQLEVHHRTYVRMAHEEDGDLFVLCEGCHDLFSKHGRLADLPVPTQKDHPQDPYIPPPKLLRSAYKYEEYYPVTTEAYRLGYTGKRKLADFIRQYGKHFEVEQISDGKALLIIQEMQERGMLKDEEREEGEERAE